jgi:hypothetical protein
MWREDNQVPAFQQFLEMVRNQCPGIARHEGCRRLMVAMTCQHLVRSCVCRDALGTMVQTLR